MGKEVSLQLAEYQVGPQMVGEITAYWDKEEIRGFSAKNLLTFLIRNHRDLFTGFTTEDDLTYILEQDDEQRASIRRGRESATFVRIEGGEITPTMKNVLRQAQNIAGEQPVNASHLLYGILQGQNEALDFLVRARTNIPGLQNKLTQQITSSQAA